MIRIELNEREHGTQVRISAKYGSQKRKLSCLQ